jgi:hypothetical protein
MIKEIPCPKPIIDCWQWHKVYCYLPRKIVMDWQWTDTDFKGIKCFKVHKEYLWRKKIIKSGGNLNHEWIYKFVKD